LHPLIDLPVGKFAQDAGVGIGCAFIRISVYLRASEAIVFKLNFLENISVGNFVYLPWRISNNFGKIAGNRQLLVGKCMAKS
jgi:hypothetical protein